MELNRPGGGHPRWPVPEAGLRPAGGRAGPPGGSGRGGDGGSASPYLTVFAASMGAIDISAEPGVRVVLHAIKATGANDADFRRMTTVILTLASEVARQTLDAA